MIRRPPRSTLDRSSAASDVYKRQILPYIAVVFGIIAIAKGRRAQKTIAKSPEKYINAGDAMAGVIMGSIVVGLFVLAVLILTVYLMALSGILNLPNW